MLFKKNILNQYCGVIHTLLPNTKYEFSVYAFNSYNYNIPSAYSKPIITKPLIESREFKFDAYATVGKSKEIKNTGHFSKCSVIINYQQRRYFFQFSFLCLIFRLSLVYTRLNYTYDICRFVHSQLLFINNNLYLVIKMVSSVDVESYIQIQLSVLNLSDGDGMIDMNSIRLSKNIMNILREFNYVFPTQLVFVWKASDK